MTQEVKLNKMPSVLAFERRIDCSNGIFSAVVGDELIPLSVNEKSVKGTISNRLKKNEAEPEKLDAKISVANLQTVDAVTLPPQLDTLSVTFSLKFLPFTGQPNSCNEQTIQQRIETLVQSYKEKHGVKALAERYAYNIVNGRWLWRNRANAEEVTVKVKLYGETYIFDNAKNIPLKHTETAKITNQEGFKALVETIESALRGDDIIQMDVQGLLKMGAGQEVYPSQELILDKRSVNKSKVLYAVQGQAAFHSQKIGNAIRTIDDWYSEDAKTMIAVEPFGSCANIGLALRQPKSKLDFYTLFDNWVLKGVEPDVNQAHYVMAVLIRGGVFGESGRE